MNTIYDIYDMGKNTVYVALPPRCADEQVVAGALKWVNTIRGEFDLPALTALPRGTPNAARECPLALALRDIGEVEVASGRAYLQHKGRFVQFPLPSDVAIFVMCFDRRMLPELIDVSAMTDEQIVEETLQWVNTIRGEHNLEALLTLPNGTRSAATDCALARALTGIGDLSCKVPPRGRHQGDAGLRYALDGKVVTRPVPPAVQEFMCRFDAGKLDHLLT